MRIKRLAIDDYEAITTLWERAQLPFRPRGRDSKEAILKEIHANPDFFLGVFDRDRLVAVAILSCDMRKGWINRLAVDPEYRLQGIAKALIAKSEKIFRSKGIKLFSALIDTDNEASRELFKKCGYTEQHGIAYFSKRDSQEI